MRYAATTVALDMFFKAPAGKRCELLGPGSVFSFRRVCLKKKKKKKIHALKLREVGVALGVKQNTLSVDLSLAFLNWSIFPK